MAFLGGVGPIWNSCWIGVVRYLTVAISLEQAIEWKRVFFIISLYLKFVINHKLYKMMMILAISRLVEDIYTNYTKLAAEWYVHFQYFSSFSKEMIGSSLVWSLTETFSKCLSSIDCWSRNFCLNSKNFSLAFQDFMGFHRLTDHFLIGIPLKMFNRLITAYRV